VVPSFLVDAEPRKRV